MIHRILTISKWTLITFPWFLSGYMFYLNAVTTNELRFSIEVIRALLSKTTVCT